MGKKKAKKRKQIGQTAKVVKKKQAPKSMTVPEDKITFVPAVSAQSILEVVLDTQHLLTMRVRQLEQKMEALASDRGKDKLEESMGLLRVDVAKLADEFDEHSKQCDGLVHSLATKVTRNGKVLTRITSAFMGKPKKGG